MTTAESDPRPGDPVVAHRHRDLELRQPPHDDNEAVDRDPGASGGRRSDRAPPLTSQVAAQMDPVLGEGTIAEVLE